MYLLNVHTKKLEEFIDPIPPYAILSHTWGKDEITYQDIRVPTGTAYKAGWSKIDNACKKVQAGTGKYNYIWIDTCCIDKTSSAELSESINSMFKWYMNAATCYAYFSDVKQGSSASEILKSRWFTRGWTLQELIAPNKITFLDENWDFIGTKFRLGKEISVATGIPTSILLDVDTLSSTSIACRMSWAAERNTTRIEDLAYCLLGIFGVNMPLLYGEGEKAFLRLQEEILKISDDQSIFAWDTKDQRSAVLAQRPSDFSSSRKVVPIPRNPDHGPFSMTNIGLSIQLLLIPTSAYFDSKEIQIALLDCQIRNDFSKQVVMYLYETNTLGTYARCAYRGAYFGTVDLNRIEKPKLRSLYIESHWRSLFKRQDKISCCLFPYGKNLEGYIIEIANVNGVSSSYDPITATIQIERRPEAFSHDVAMGIIFCQEHLTHTSGFMVVAYFPHKSFIGTQLSGLRIYDKPVDWPLDEWLKKSREDISSLHIQETVSSPETSIKGTFTFTVITREGETMSYLIDISADLELKSVLNQHVYTLSIQ